MRVPNNCVFICLVQCSRPVAMHKHTYTVPQCRRTVYSVSYNVECECTFLKLYICLHTKKIRRDKRVGNWRDFQTDPTAKKVKASNFKEETREEAKHGVVKMETWKKNWK